MTDDLKEYTVVLQVTLPVKARNASDAELTAREELIIMNGAEEVTLVRVVEEE